MKAKVIKMMVWIGLLVLLLGENRVNLTLAGGGPVPTGPQGAKSAILMLAGGGPVPTGPRVAISVVS